MRRRGFLHTRQHLLNLVWGYSSMPNTRTVDTHVRRLRDKLGSAAAAIEAIRNVGYRVRNAEEEITVHEVS